MSDGKGSGGTAASFAILWGRAARAAEIELGRLTGDVDADQALLVEPGRTPALRLNSDTGRRAAPERLRELAGTEAKLAALKAEAARGLDLFARHPRRFLDLYFAFVAARIEAERPALAERLAWSGGLFGPEDWAYSALRPLPRAALAQVEGDKARPVQPAADVAFWTGEEALLVLLRATGAAQAAAALPPAWPVRTVALPPAELAAPDALFTPQRFGEAFLGFWQGEDWPAGPWRPRGLEGLGAG